MTIDVQEFERRLAGVRARLEAQGVDALLASARENVAYLCGTRITPYTRLIGVLVPARDEAVVIVPALDGDLASQNPAGLPFRIWTDETGPYGVLGEELSKAGTGTLAIDKTAVNVRVYESLRGLVEIPAHADATAILDELRLRKSPPELDALRRAAVVADTVFSQLPSMLRPDRTEAEIVAEFDALMYAAGSEEPAFETTVLAGPNATAPHARPTRRRLEPGDIVVVDAGGVVDGYCSDITRMFSIGEPSAEDREVIDVVNAALAAGVDAARAGTRCCDVDAASRRVIEDAGYGRYFTHRTGHCLGLTPSEEPSLVAGEEHELLPGMVITVEPGIYIAGRIGVRIEDEVVIGPDGTIEILNKLPRDVVVCG